MRVGFGRRKRQCGLFVQKLPFGLGRFSRGLETGRFFHPCRTRGSPLHLPFWRIQAKFSGIHLESYADLLRLANLPKAVQRGWEDQKAGFWIPAFKLQPQLFLRLGRTLTLFQGKEGHECELPASVLHPVTLPIEEAVEGLVITVAAFSVPRKFILPRLHEIRAEVEGYRLCYVPFLLTSNECIQPNIGVSVSRNALCMGRSI